MLKRVKQEVVEDAFAFVKKTFFPRWDRQGWWKIKVKSRLGRNIGGGCSKSKLEIHITSKLDCRDQNDFEDRLHRIIIHEVSHAVNLSDFGCHALRWLTTMEKATRKARKLGFLNVAYLLEGDIEHYTIDSNCATITFLNEKFSDLIGAISYPNPDDPKHPIIYLLKNRDWKRRKLHKTHLRNLPCAICGGKGEALLSKKSKTIDDLVIVRVYGFCGKCRYWGERIRGIDPRPFLIKKEVINVDRYEQELVEEDRKRGGNS